MHKEYFRIDAFTGSTGHIVAQCLELGQISTCNSLDDAIRSAINQNAALLIEAEKNNFCPFNILASEEIWGIYRPTMPIAMEVEHVIGDRYIAVFRGYDVTNVKDPMNIILREPIL